VLHRDSQRREADTEARRNRNLIFLLDNVKDVRSDARKTVFLSPNCLNSLLFTIGLIPSQARNSSLVCYTAMMRSCIFRNYALARRTAVRLQRVNQRNTLVQLLAIRCKTPGKRDWSEFTHHVSKSLAMTILGIWIRDSPFSALSKAWLLPPPPLFFWTQTRVGRKIPIKRNGYLSHILSSGLLLLLQFHPNRISVNVWGSRFKVF